MLAAAAALNSLMTAIFGAVLAPFRALHPMWAIAAVSVLTGVIMLWIFGKVSNQRAIRDVRTRISGNLIGVRLFQSDTWTVFRLQGRILRDTFAYMLHSFIPMLVMMPPVLLIMIQLNLFFGARPLHEGERALVKVHLREAVALDSPIELTASEGIEIETPPVRIKALQEACWRIRVTAGGSQRLKIKVGGQEIEKLVSAGSGWARVPMIRTSSSPWDLLLWPGEPPLDPSGAIESVEVRHPASDIRVAGFSVHWLLAFFVLSILSGFAFKGVLGVNI